MGQQGQHKLNKTKNSDKTKVPPKAKTQTGLPETHPVYTGWPKQQKTQHITH